MKKTFNTWQGWFVVYWLIVLITVIIDFPSTTEELYIIIGRCVVSTLITIVLLESIYYLKNRNKKTEDESITYCSKCKDNSTENEFYSATDIFNNIY